MRVGEILAWDDDDADLANALIRIRGSKTLPLRVIPVLPSVVRRLTAYKAERNTHFDALDARAFFRGVSGARLTYDSFHRSFRRVVDASGIGCGALRRPRIHDLRHYADLRVMPNSSSVDSVPGEFVVLHAA